MIKVVHITTSKQGGAGIATCRIHESLRQDGRVDSHILQMLPLTPQDSMNNIHRCTHFHPFSYRVKKRLGLLPYFSKIEYYKRIIENQPKDYEFVSLPFSYFPIHEHPLVKEADIINLHWVSEFIDYPSFFTHIEKPIIWTLHDMNPFLGIFHYEGDMKRNTNKIIKNIDKKIKEKKLDYIRSNNNIHVVSPSKWLEEYSMNSDIFKNFNHSVIANPFDSHQYKKLDKDYCKTILNKKEKINILFIAESIQNYRKGMDLLLDALNRLSPESYELISVGGGNIENLLNSDVQYTSYGMIKDKNLLNLIYSAADVTIIPSREDNLPNVMFESMLNGTPVISFNSGGMAEHIKTGENGILVTELSSEALARAIKDFINNEYKFDHDEVRQYPIDNLNYRKQADAYISLYKSILNQ